MILKNFQNKIATYINLFIWVNLLSITESMKTAEELNNYKIIFTHTRYMNDFIIYFSLLERNIFFNL